MNKKTLTIAAAVLTIAGATSAFAAELPTYEANGFPVSPVQVGVLGAGHVEQQVAAPTTVASAHQVKVLSSRKVKTADVTTGAAR
ncbi:MULTISPECIES: hypothetical protein [Bradyrhizobium]|uniref:Secreted protein n=1 Tax=Bradyrhizobium zhanjiangense TaxID=1325107 RepID=A0ABY0DCY7_9BRAD|nr:MULTISPECIES: hypothetical protein [Bradyrhizobium]RXG89481.1 hypothetical protein EAS62_31285 [Bradyrhizobium zhanjiangense]SDH81305.1 hypothetical protein SAMN05216338_1013170 [Bradyrhizobium sp. Rc2d]